MATDDAPLAQLIAAAQAAAQFAEQTFKAPQSVPQVEAAVHALDAATRALDFAKNLDVRAITGKRA